MKLYPIVMWLASLSYGCANMQTIGTNDPITYLLTYFSNSKWKGRAAEFGNKVNSLNLAGKGEVEACKLTYPTSSVIKESVYQMCTNKR